MLTDVTQGGASINDGQIEMMVHRRVMNDDSRGVQEPLNETMCGCNDIGAKPGAMGAHGHEGDGVVEEHHARLGDVDRRDRDHPALQHSLDHGGDLA